MYKQKIQKAGLHLLAALILILLFLFFLGESSYAATWNGNKLYGTAKYEKVDIELETYLMEDGRLVAIEDPTRIRAGDNTAYVPYIINIGEECNLRIRVYANTQKQKNINILKYCYGYQNKWISKNGWFYLKPKFEKHAKIKLCDGFNFPDDWKWQEEGNNLLSITIEAEAVNDEDIPPQTGDHTVLVMYLLTLTASLVMIILMLTKNDKGADYYGD